MHAHSATLDASLILLNETLQLNTTNVISCDWTWWHEMTPLCDIFDMASVSIHVANGVAMSILELMRLFKMFCHWHSNGSAWMHAVDSLQFFGWLHRSKTMPFVETASPASTALSNIEKKVAIFKINSALKIFLKRKHTNHSKWFLVINFAVQIDKFALFSQLKPPQNHKIKCYYLNGTSKMY